MLFFPDSDLRHCLKMADALVFYSVLLVLLINNKVMKDRQGLIFVVVCVLV